LLGAAAALRRAIGAPLPPSQRPCYERHLAAARATLPGETFTAAWDEGYATPLEEAVALGLEGDPYVITG
jgi:hypothetical protein